METIKQKAKLYLPESNNPAADIECRIAVDIDRRTQLCRWHGTLEILKEYQSIHPLIFQQFRLQLEDGRSGTIFITHHRLGSWGETIFFRGAGSLVNKLHLQNQSSKTPTQTASQNLKSF